MKHVAGERMNDAALLGQGDERHWWDELTRRMVPAHEALDANGVAGRKGEFRLEVQDELAVLDSATKLNNQLVFLGSAILKFWSIHDDVGVLVL